MLLNQNQKKAIEELYPEQFKNDKISFTAVNLDDDISKAIAEKCKASGQSLLVIGGGKRIDLTSQGFMYARTNTAKLKEELQKAIDPLMEKKQ